MTRSVLIVDDEPFIRRLIATTLGDGNGFDIEEAGDGLEALAAAQSQAPAIVFLDIDMPRLGGYETCRRLRELPEARDATIVMLTAAGPDAEAEARAAGADLFLTKPFSPLEVLRLVHGLENAAS